MPVVRIETSTFGAVELRTDTVDVALENAAVVDVNLSLIGSLRVFGVFAGI